MRVQVRACTDFTPDYKVHSLDINKRKNKVNWKALEPVGAAIKTHRNLVNLCSFDRIVLLVITTTNLFIYLLIFSFIHSFIFYLSGPQPWRPHAAKLCPCLQPICRHLAIIMNIIVIIIVIIFFIFKFWKDSLGPQRSSKTSGFLLLSGRGSLSITLIT